MAKQDPNPLPYGALPYYQVHYIVETEKTILDPFLFMAKCKPIIKGHFNNKKITDLEWTGGRLANMLKEDNELTAILKLLLVNEGEVRIDPQKDRIRIYTKWKREDKLNFDLKLFEVVEKIAATIKKLSN